MKSGIGLLAAILAVAPVKAQSNAGYGVGHIDEGLVIGAVVGAAAVVGVGVTFLVLLNRGVAEGCIVESGGKRTFVTADKTVYSVSDASPALPVGDRVKVKGHKSGPSTARSIQVDRVLRDYGRCTP